MRKLRNMNRKELCMWSANVKTKELKEILKEEGIKGYSKFKKAELLENVLDLVITVDVEIIDNPSEDTNSIFNNMIVDTIENFDCIKMVKNTLETNLKTESLVNCFAEMKGIKKQEKTKKEYIQEAINNNNNKLNYIIKNISNLDKERKNVSEINKVLEELKSGLRVETLVEYNNSINFKSYIFAENICIELNDYDIYIPVLDKYLGKDRSWIDEVLEAGKTIRETHYNNKNLIYLIGSDEDIHELPIFVQGVQCGILEHRHNIFNSPISRVEMWCTDYYDVYNLEGDNTIYFSISTDEILDYNKVKKGQQATIKFLTDKAVEDLLNKTINVQIELNNPKLLLI